MSHFHMFIVEILMNKFNVTKSKKLICIENILYTQDITIVDSYLCSTGIWRTSCWWWSINLLLTCVTTHVL